MTALLRRHLCSFLMFQYSLVISVTNSDVVGHLKQKKLLTNSYYDQLCCEHCSAPLYSVSVASKYSIHNLICDVISYCASKFVIKKLSVYDQIVV